MGGTMKIFVADPNELRVTDAPTLCTLQRIGCEVEECLNAGGTVAPICVIGQAKSCYLILDGHNRAYLLAERNVPIHALLLNSIRDPDTILELEGRSAIPRFPHREYLKGNQSLAQLRSMAARQARRLGNVTIEHLRHVDLDSREALQHNFAAAPARRERPQEPIGMQPVSCLAIRDPSLGREYYVPVATSKREEVVRRGYATVEVTDHASILEGVEWAKKARAVLNEGAFELCDI